MSKPPEKESGFLVFHRRVTDLGNFPESRANMAAAKAIRSGDKKDAEDARVKLAVSDDRKYFAETVVRMASDCWPRDEKGTCL